MPSSLNNFHIKSSGSVFYPVFEKALKQRTRSVSYWRRNLGTFGTARDYQPEQKIYFDDYQHKIPPRPVLVEFAASLVDSVAFCKSTRTPYLTSLVSLSVRILVELLSNGKPRKSRRGPYIHPRNSKLSLLVPLNISRG